MLTPSTLAPFADQRIMRDTPATLYAQFVDQYGEARNAGTVVASAVDVNDTTVLADTTATYDSTTARYSVSLSAYANLGLLTTTWEATSSESVETTVEVVSGYYFTVAQAQAWKNGELADQTAYSTALIRSTRDEVEREFERVCWPFVPRYRRVIVQARGGCRIYLPDMHIREVSSIRELSSTGATAYTWTAADLAALLPDASGQVESLLAPFPNGPVAVEYTYGFTRPPADVLDAAYMRLRYRMNMARSGVPERAQSYSLGANGGSYGLTVAGRGQSITGQPDVDVVLNDPRYRRPLVGIA